MGLLGIRLVPLLVLVVLATAAAARADSGLIVRGSSVSGSALEPLVPLPNGVILQPTAILIELAALAYAEADLLVYDFDARQASVAGAEVGAILLQSVSGAGSLDALLNEPGALAWFETSGDADPEAAEAFWIHGPSSGAVLYELPGFGAWGGGSGGGSVCGNGSCEAGEDCTSCSADCGTCPPVCGDGSCEAGEDCASCGADCGACPPVCGNGSCEAGEDCTSCSADCGTCPPVCGNGSCEAGEDCTSCSADCGACPPVCGNGRCETGEDCTSCRADCGACPLPCGDVTIDGIIDGADVRLYREHLASLPAGRLSRAALERCSVIGAPTRCNILDTVVLRRSLAGLRPPIVQVCPAAL